MIAKTITKDGLSGEVRTSTFPNNIINEINFKRQSFENLSRLSNIKPL